MLELDSVTSNDPSAFTQDDKIEKKLQEKWNKKWFNLLLNFPMALWTDGNTFKHNYYPLHHFQPGPRRWRHGDAPKLHGGGKICTNYCQLNQA
jgi:hypothetical protein